MISSRIIVFSTLFIFITVGFVTAVQMKHKTVKVDIDKAKSLEINFNFSAGELRLYPDDIDNVAIVDMDYDERIYEYNVDYKATDGVGKLLLESIHDSDDKIDTDRNQWDVTFSTKYPMTLDIRIGAAKASLDLGGLRLKEVNMDVGAASAEFDFYEKNPIRLKKMNVKAGAASLDMRNIGNVNFKEMNFEGGVGSYDLDFRGDYTGESKIDITVGLGAIDVILPKNIPIHVETESNGFFSSVKFHQDNLEKIDNDIYESPDFDKAKIRIFLNVKVGMGSVDLKWRK